MDAGQIWTWVQAQGIRLFEGVLVLAVGLFAVHWLMKLIERHQGFLRIEATLKGFLENLLRLVLYLTVILTAVSVLGIPLTSVVALLASAGVAVSLAMQGALSNLVGGLTLLLLKPIRAGEYVKVGETEGTVRTVGVFYTELATPDNRHISMPNSNLTNAAIVNFTRLGTRRLDVYYSVSYRADMEQVLAVLTELVRKNAAVLPDPAPAVHLQECGDSALKFVVRLWCRSEDYWDLYYYLTEEGKRALDQAGIEIPYPQLDVHVK